MLPMERRLLLCEAERHCVILAWTRALALRAHVLSAGSHCVEYPLPLNAQSTVPSSLLTCSVIPRGEGFLAPMNMCLAGYPL